MSLEVAGTGRDCSENTRYVLYRVDLVVNLPYSASLSKYKNWLLASGRQSREVQLAW